ncbi:MAG: uracil-DNA glycosylase [Pseudomonadota bacterium]
MESHEALAVLQWQVELGATEAISDAPVNRYDAPAQPKQALKPIDAPQAEAADPVAAADASARAARSLDDLRDALAAYPHCELRKGARNLVFSDGNPSARLMIIGEAPGRDEDIEGRPFVGRAGQLLDKMLAAIEMGRALPDSESAVYITNILPWRPPQNRDPEAEEIAMMLPFVRRHIELVDPQVIVLMGNIACQALLGRKGITRLRGNWTEAAGRPTLPMFHPAYLLRNPAAKRDAWHDLLMLRHKLAAA